MTYYRPAPTRLVWGVVMALLLAWALWLAGRATLAAVRDDERARVLAEGSALTRQALEHAQRLARERDSLAVLVAQRDTVLITRIKRVRDTAWLPADTTPAVRLVACRAQLDTLATACDTFRQAASVALAKADTSSRRDSAALAGLSLQLAAVRRADSLKAVQLAGGARRHAFERGACAAAIVGNVLQWRAR